MPLPACCFAFADRATGSLGPDERGLVTNASYPVLWLTQRIGQQRVSICFARSPRRAHLSPSPNPPTIQPGTLASAPRVSSLRAVPQRMAFQQAGPLGGWPRVPAASEEDPTAPLILVSR